MDHPDVVLDVDDQSGALHIGTLCPDLAVVSLRVVTLHVVHQGSRLDNYIRNIISLSKSVQRVKRVQSVTKHVL